MTLVCFFSTLSLLLLSDPVARPTFECLKIHLKFSKVLESWTGRNSFFKPHNYSVWVPGEACQFIPQSLIRSLDSISRDSYDSVISSFASNWVLWPDSASSLVEVFFGTFSMFVWCRSSAPSTSFACRINEDEEDEPRIHFHYSYDFGCCSRNGIMKNYLLIRKAFSLSALSSSPDNLRKSSLNYQTSSRDLRSSLLPKTTCQADFEALTWKLWTFAFCLLSHYPLCFHWTIIVCITRKLFLADCGKLWNTKRRNNRW